MSDIHIDIHGGNNQILPNATEAVQNFYFVGNMEHEAASDISPQVVSEEVDEPFTPEEQALLPYVRNEQTLRQYLRQIERCQSARDLAEILIHMQEQEQKVLVDELQRERYIEKFLLLVPKGVKGMTAHNVYTHITNLRASRPRKTGK